MTQKHTAEHGPFAPMPEMELHYEPQYKKIRFWLNGTQVEKVIDMRASLTDVLRNDFSMTSVKKGCEVGECGACAVLIDGEAFDSCIYMGIWADGKNIWTAEGLTGENGKLSVVQQAFVNQAAVQCGFCTPGFIVTSSELVERATRNGKRMTREEIQTGLAGHLCRCTGYEDIFRAVEEAMDLSIAASKAE